MFEDLRTAIDGQLPFDPPLSAPGPGVGRAEPIDDGAPVDGFTISTVAPGGSSHLVYVNENLARLLGYEASQLVGRCPSVLFHERTPAEQLDAIARIVDDGAQAVVPVHLAHADGGPVPLEGTFVRLPTLDPSPLFLAAYRDRRRATHLLSEHGNALERLASGRRLDEVLSHVAAHVERLTGSGRAWFALVDRAGGLQPVLTGDLDRDVVRLALDELRRRHAHTGHDVASVWVDELPDTVARPLHAAGVDGLWLVPVVCSGDQTCGLLAVAHPDAVGPTRDERHVLAQLARIAALAVERDRTQATLAHQALHDHLTGLPNRTLIMDRLEQAVARLGRDQRTLALLVVDIDRFKLINDSRGFLVGDQVLLEVSRRLRSVVRLGDTVGRLGGDQFAAICVAVDDDGDVANMAERVTEAVARPIAVGDVELHVTASVGAVVVTRSGRSAAALISSAETALQRAVTGGRGRWALYEEGSRQRIVVRHEIERALHVAITEDELVLHYQPVVDLGSGRMVGAEALARWDRPGHGLLPPSAFIDIAEETGLIVPLGRWALDQACRDLAAWPVDAAGRRPLVSVNLSARQLADPTLVASVLAALDRHALEPANLGLEVTESVRVEELDVVTTSLQELSGLGCTLSIDDFGVGYATLDYLRRFSMAHALKIDRSFINGLGRSREDTAIVSASVALARSLGLAVVAEGVERPEQLAELRALGIERAQGHAISPAVDVERARSLWEIGKLIEGADG